MEYLSITLIVLLPIITILLHDILKSSKLPPGPRPWPIIGNIHLIGSMPHRSVANLCKTYGPLMSLKLGSITTIVISSPDLAKQMFLRHDLPSSSRYIPDGGGVGNHDKISVLWLPVGPKWRELRKIMAVHLFSNQSMDASQGLRRKKLDELVCYAKECCEKSVAIDIGKAAMITTLNLLSNTVFSTDFSSYDSSVSMEFGNLIRAIMGEAAKPNVSDFFPLIRGLDLQGINRRQTVNFHKMMGFLDGIIEERRLGNEKGAKEDFLGVLLNHVNENELTIDEAKHLLIDIFIAGGETTSGALEWTMAELLRNPKKLTKAQDEIDKLLSNENSRSIQESDIPNLPYIQAIVNETLRLHPATPFLVPRKLEKDVQLSGHLLPKNAQVWVNTWSISRDPSIWPNAKSFEPERFMESEINVKGQNFELIPFGAGRRICPGMPFAHRMLHIMLATLLHSFNWKLDGGLNPEDLDMEEKWGLSVPKAQPLKAIPLPR